MTEAGSNSAKANPRRPLAGNMFFFPAAACWGGAFALLLVLLMRVRPQRRRDFNAGQDAERDAAARRIP